jgi:spermidine synthase
MEKRLFGPVFLFGFCLLQAQILLFREFLVLSYGNELALGGMLILWLVGTGLGSVAGGRFFSEEPRGKAYFLLPLSMACLLLTSLSIVRLGPSWLGYSRGEMFSLFAWSALGLGSLFPFCFISGILFPYFAHLTKGSRADWTSILKVYWAEALGAAAGGFAGLFLIRWVNGFDLAFLINTGLAVCSYWLWRIQPEKSPGDRIGIVPLIMILVFLIPLFGPGAVIELKSRVKQWQPFTLKMIQETPFGNLALAERNGQYGFFLNGVFQFSSPDPRMAEEKTHPALLSHPRPRSVLVIGGGLTGTVREILKHPSIEKADFIELDPDWVKGVGRFLPEVRPLLSPHPKTRLLLGDGRRLLRKMENQYDVILLDQAGPVSLLLNRFYSQEFFLSAKDHLNPGGLLVLVLNGPAEMIGVTQAETLRSLFRTLTSVFPETVFFTGEEINLLGFRESPETEISASLLLKRLTERSLDLQYLNPLHIQTLFSPWRIGYFKRIVADDPLGEINRDLKPVSFYKQLLSDLSLHHPWPAAFLKWTGEIPLLVWIGFILFLGAGLLLWSLIFPRTRSVLPILTSIGVGGFSAMALEFLILTLFQIGLGVLYLEIGLLMAFFMVGLAGGTYLFIFRAPLVFSNSRAMAGLQGFFSLFFLLLFIPLKGMGIWPETLLKFILYSLMLIGGALGGAIYALCTRKFDGLGHAKDRTAGTLYGVDLLGAALASLVIPFFCLPLWGMTWTLIGLSLVNGLTALFLAAGPNLILDKR